MAERGSGDSTVVDRQQKMERVLAQMVQRLGPDHVDCSGAHANLAMLLAEANLATALPHFQAAIQGYSKTLGAEHEKTSSVIKECQFFLARQSNQAGTGRTAAAGAGGGSVEELSEEDEEGDGVEDMPPVRPEGAADDVPTFEDPSVPRVRYTIPDNSKQASWLSTFFLFLMTAPAAIATLFMIMDSGVGIWVHETCVKVGACVSYRDQLVEIYTRTNQAGKTATKIKKIPRLLKKWKGKETELIAEVSAKYSADEMSDLGSWQQMLRALCPIDVEAQQAEAIGATVAVLVASALVYLCCRGGGEEREEKMEEVSWSGDEDEDDDAPQQLPVLVEPLLQEAGPG